MKFATIGHFLDKKSIDFIPGEWRYNDLYISPEIDIKGVKGYICVLPLTSKQIINEPRDIIRNKILNSIIFLQDNFKVGVIQLGALTTSVTQGGKWLTDKNQIKSYINHGDSYTAAVLCQVVHKVLNYTNKKVSDCVLSVVGSYGIIGEAVSKLLVPNFKHTILIGRKTENLKNLEQKIEGNYETTKELITKKADIIITATSHPSALLNSRHLKENAIVVDVSQPPNLSIDICNKRPDILRVDGGYVDLPISILLEIPGIPKGKIFSCVAEVIMQAMENEKENHVGSIDLLHLKKTEKWALKYGFTLNNLTNFGESLKF